MKILKNNYNTDTEKKIIKDKEIEPYPREITCESCKSVLEYEKGDLEMGVLGCMHLRCPCCGYENMIDDNENNIELTKDNVEWPVHFFHTSKNVNAVEHCNNENVKTAIRRAIDYFRKNKNEFEWFTECGDMYVSVYRYDGDEDYYIVVSNDFYSTYINFEDKDYNENYEDYD